MRSTTLLEEFADFSVWHDPAYACLYATWQGTHGEGRTKAQYTLLREYVVQTNSRKLLSDSLLDENGWSKAIDWIAEHGFQRLAEAGLQSVAWVLPRQSAAFFDTARMLSQLQQPLVSTFIDAQAAYDWLHYLPEQRENLAKKACPDAISFVLLPPVEQLALASSQGCKLAARWETEFYVTPYKLPNGLLVEAYYHVHSGELHQIHTLPQPTSTGSS